MLAVIKSLIISVQSLNVSTYDLSYDEGPYLRVVASNEADVQIVAPKPKEGTTFISLDEGFTINMTCSIFNESKDFEVNWLLSGALNDGQLTKYKGRNDFSIELENVKPINSGPIKCTARAISSEDDELIRNIVLRVRPSKFLLTSLSNRKKENSHLKKNV
jgi:hypothetical protein